MAERLSLSIREGMRVFGSDNAPIGTIRGLRGYEFLVDDRYVFPRSCVARVEGDNVYLPNPATQYLSQTGPQDGRPNVAIPRPPTAPGEGVMEDGAVPQ